MSGIENPAPGWPGIEPRWTSSAKSGVGTALSAYSRVWFTLSHGILNEIYYPRVDQACTRDCGFLVTDGSSYFSEEKRHAQSRVTLIREGIPAYKLTNSSQDGRYVITKEIITDPWRDVVLQRILFTPEQSAPSGYHLYLLLAPHLGNRGYSNTGWIGEYKGNPMLFARRDDLTLACACSVPWLKRSVGYVGVSDGWQDLFHHHEMQWAYTRAENGNISLTAEIDLAAANGQCIIAIGFGTNEAEAGLRALSSLQSGFDSALDAYCAQWDGWFRSLHQNHVGSASGRLTAAPNGSRTLSAAVVRTHEDMRFMGGIIASLSVPWGQDKGDDDLGGYHLVWVRDLAEAAGGLLAAGAHNDVRRVLDYLRATQEADGHWPQNMWLDGSQFWTGIQMDEVAFPILLLDLAHREGVIDKEALNGFYDMVHRAAGYIARNGPVTGQDRWEEDAGYSPFTLAVEIVGLLAASVFLDEAGDNATATYLREIAQYWNLNIERWCYVYDTQLARELGVEGYYVRIAPPEVGDAASPASGFVPIKNRPAGVSNVPASQIVSADALALVRFGLRAPDDPRILSTINAIDRMLKVETPFGPVWHRYNQDGYGEHEDGRAYDGTGIGRAWPLLTGERAHYELNAGHVNTAKRLLNTLESFASEIGLLPEQIWDAPDIPDYELFFGKPAGSAMPLVWAHAEQLKLVRSLNDGKVFDAPSDSVVQLLRQPESPHWVPWRYNNKCKSIGAGKTLRIELLSPAVVRWTSDSWRSCKDMETAGTSLGIHYCVLPLEELPAGNEIEFTIFWKGRNSWEGQNFALRVAPSEVVQSAKPRVRARKSGTGQLVVP